MITTMLLYYREGSDGIQSCSRYPQRTYKVWRLLFDAFLKFLARKPHGIAGHPTTRSRKRAAMSRANKAHKVLRAAINRLARGHTQRKTMYRKADGEVSVCLVGATQYEGVTSPAIAAAQFAQALAISNLCDEGKLTFNENDPIWMYNDGQLNQDLAIEVTKLALIKVETGETPDKLFIPHKDILPTGRSKINQKIARTAVPMPGKEYEEFLNAAWKLSGRTRPDF
jgi:hypothetical protein